MCLSSPSRLPRHVAKADQRPPAAELTFWLPRHGSFVEGNTVFFMEELRLYGPTVPTSWSPAMASTIPGVGWRVDCGTVVRASGVVPLSCSSWAVKLHYSLCLYLLIVFFLCASPQFNSTPAVFDCIRDEL